MVYRQNGFGMLGQLFFPGLGGPGQGGPGGFTGGFPGGYPGQGGFPNQGGYPGFPGQGGFQGGYPGGQQQSPNLPPPPDAPPGGFDGGGYGNQPSLQAVDPGSFYRCLYRYTWVRLENGRAFWFYPTFIGRRSVAGYRWRRSQRRWVYYSTDTNRIAYFSCN
ncbi:hypothetical protein N781_14615 [Pontibacillus halophilus JSM 076056 = DSM 19796]|uniref:Transporter n=1 Tax=Pontibacillus halophilus JSM 076056 = DSM 19796 TaxID=1385510 RepID=A0A0A5GKS8_9BACI|nr:hypothetical protein [Pontibacillus halophilus]KGX92564.1 hypothetical protein N781_14615 [Pontibacillus halophilus JSM 076056 = DSM 19796]